MESVAMEDLLSERAQRLFLLSDHERKGFIVRRDMQRMRSEIPLSPEQLESVFDSLDVEGNGFLTIEQFLSGFGEFLHSKSAPSPADLYSMDEDDSGVGMPSPVDVDEEPDAMDRLLQQIEDSQQLSSTNVLRQLVSRVRRDAGPSVQNKMEAFLSQLYSDLLQRQEDVQRLESILRAKDEEHNQQVQQLFEEMEAQLSEDKEAIVQQEERRSRLAHAALNRQLNHREEQLAEAEMLHKRVVEEASMLRSGNMALQRRKEELERRLDSQWKDNLKLQRKLEEVERDKNFDRQTHISTGFRLAWAIMLEQQGLVQQLEMLRKMADTLVKCHMSLDETERQSWTEKQRRPKESKRFFCRQASSLTNPSSDDYEYDEEVYRVCPSKLNLKESHSAVSSVEDNHPSLQEELARCQKEDDGTLKLPFRELCFLSACLPSSLKDQVLDGVLKCVSGLIVAYILLGLDWLWSS